MRAMASVTTSTRTKDGVRPSARHGLMVAVMVILLLLVSAFAWAAWYFSSALLDVSHSVPAYAVRVLSVTPGEVTLRRTKDAARPGTFGIDWPGGHAVITTLLGRSGGAVTRRLSGPTFGLRPGIRVSIDAYTYLTPSALRIAYSTLRFPDPLGRMPAWFVSGGRSTWVIVVHGYGSQRREGIRPMPVLIRQHLNVLDISYRNDAGAPASPDHIYHLGWSEWIDVQAAVRFALSHGAHDVILYGYSMGGGMVEDFLRRSPLAPRVRAVILDAPALDWGPVLALAARERSLPGPLTWLAEFVTAKRLGISSLDTLNSVANPPPRMPATLLFHGTDDTTVPSASSRRFAREHPAAVELDLVQGADHTQEWNVDPAGYDAVLNRFLTRVLR